LAYPYFIKDCILTARALAAVVGAASLSTRWLLSAAVLQEERRSSRLTGVERPPNSPPTLAATPPHRTRLACRRQSALRSLGSLAPLTTLPKHEIIAGSGIPRRLREFSDAQQQRGAL
jgi:hypothetical protein